MDRIIVFKKGDVIEDGKHEELMLLQGEYSMLWSMQRNGFLPEDIEEIENEGKEYGKI
jgi:ABC-type transport system involved in cytochrome bd biosynthesis fused ATPase/permease subunit